MIILYHPSQLPGRRAHLDREHNDGGGGDVEDAASGPDRQRDGRVEGGADAGRPRDHLRPQAEHHQSGRGQGKQYSAVQIYP